MVLGSTRKSRPTCSLPSPRTAPNAAVQHAALVLVVVPVAQPAVCLGALAPDSGALGVALCFSLGSEVQAPDPSALVHLAVVRPLTTPGWILSLSHSQKGMSESSASYVPAAAGGVYSGEDAG